MVLEGNLESIWGGSGRLNRPNSVTQPPYKDNFWKGRAYGNASDTPAERRETWFGIQVCGLGQNAWDQNRKDENETELD